MAEYNILAPAEQLYYNNIRRFCYKDNILWKVLSL